MPKEKQNLRINDGGKTVYEREIGPSVRKVIEAHGLTMSDTEAYTDDVWKEGPSRLDVNERISQN